MPRPHPKVYKYIVLSYFGGRRRKGGLNFVQEPTFNERPYHDYYTPDKVQSFQEPTGEPRGKKKGRECKAETLCLYLWNIHAKRSPIQKAGVYLLQTALCLGSIN